MTVNQWLLLDAINRVADARIARTKAQETYEAFQRDREEAWRKLEEAGNAYHEAMLELQDLIEEVVEYKKANREA